MKTTTNTRSSRLIAVALLAGAALSAPAMADTVTVKFTGTNKGGSVKAAYDSVTSNVFAGQLKHTLSSPSGPAAAGLSGNFLTFCVELNQNTTSSNTVYTVSTLAARLGAAKADAIAGLFASTGLAPILGTASNDLAQAAQLAIWEIVEDYDGTPGSLSLTAGDFRATKTDGSPLTAGITGLASSMLSGVETPALSSLSFLVLTNSSKQDQLVVIPAPGAAAVVVGGGLALLRRRRRN